MTTLSSPSEPVGGVFVVLTLMRTHLWRELFLQQAQELWAQCKARLLAKDLADTVQECEASKTGGLDTLPRWDVLDALAYAPVSRGA